jgi:hypothetical protein
MNFAGTLAKVFCDGSGGLDVLPRTVGLVTSHRPRRLKDYPIQRQRRAAGASVEIDFAIEDVWCIGLYLAT